MNIDKLELVIAALKSGDYIQGRTALCSVYEDDTVHYCPLGVICEEALKDGARLVKMWMPHSLDEPLAKGHYVYADPAVEGDQSGSYLPIVVQEWLGVNSSDPMVDYWNDDDELCHDSVTALNDEAAFTFEQMAAAFADTYAAERMVYKELNHADVD